MSVIDSLGKYLDPMAKQLEEWQRDGYMKYIIIGIIGYMIYLFFFKK